MNISYQLGKHFFRIAYRVLFGCRTVGAEHVPMTGPVILASNHASYIDPPLIGQGLPRDINYLARESLFRFPLIREIIMSWNAVPVDRDGGGAKGLKNILDRLRDGGGIVLFPEGTRTLDGNLQPARLGIGLAVLKSDAPVVPVRVFGTFDAFGKRHWFPRPVRIMVKYAPPLDFSRERREAANCSKKRLKELYREVADKVMEAIARIEPYELKRTFP